MQGRESSSSSLKPLTLYCGRATIVAQPVVVEDDESLAHFVQILYEAYT